MRRTSPLSSQRKLTAHPKGRGSPSRRPGGGRPALLVEAKRCGRATRWWGHACAAADEVKDTFVDSSWYFLRFIDPRNDKALIDSAVANKMMPVDYYVGGSEHGAAAVKIFFSYVPSHPPPALRKVHPAVSLLHRPRGGKGAIPPAHHPSLAVRTHVSTRRAWSKVGRISQRRESICARMKSTNQTRTTQVAPSLPRLSPSSRNCVRQASCCRF